MNRVAVITDSNSGITQEKGKELGIFVLPMPFFIEGTEYLEDITLTQKQFYEKLLQDVDISTSQPTPGSVMQLWDEVLQSYDQIVHIPMSSGLSSSCHTAMALADEYDGRVEVVDNQRISITQRRAVMDAVALVEQGKTAREIKEQLEKEKLEASIYITLTTLKYLKKGGRITPAAAAIGTMLRLKPVLQIQGEKLDAFSKARTLSQAKTTMMDAIRNDIENRFGGMEAHDVYIDIAHTNNEAEAQKFKEEIEQAFPGCIVGFVDPLSLSISCHIGDGALAVTCTKRHAG